MEGASFAVFDDYIIALILEHACERPADAFVLEAVCKRIHKFISEPKFWERKCLSVALMPRYMFLQEHLGWRRLWITMDAHLQSPMHKRLLADWRRLEEAPKPTHYVARPRHILDITKWIVVMYGPAGTEYEGGEWEVSMSFEMRPFTTRRYPFRPPDIHFVTPVCHPNVSTNTGDVSLPALYNDFSPLCGLTYILDAVWDALANPVYVASTPDVQACKEQAREHTTLHAKDKIKF